MVNAILRIANSWRLVWGAGLQTGVEYASPEQAVACARWCNDRRPAADRAD